MNYEIYCDESCLEALVDKDSHKFMGIGSIWIPSEFRTIFKKTINKIKHNFNIYGELKWNKISPTNLNCYKEIIDFFFSCDSIRSRVIIIDSDKIDNYTFHQSDNELSFYKFYYQLINNWLLESNKYSIFLDFKLNRNKNRLHDLKKVLQNSNPESIIKNVQALPSEESTGIQLADIIVGLVTAKFNNKNKSDAKLNLIHYIEQNKIKKEISPTNKSENKFNIFKIILSGS